MLGGMADLMEPGTQFVLDGRFDSEPLKHGSGQKNSLDCVSRDRPKRNRAPPSHCTLYLRRSQITTRFTITLRMIQNQMDYIVAAFGLAVLLIILTWASCDRIEKRFDRLYTDLSGQMRVIESKLDEVRKSVDRPK